jgi:hypothetical protein
VPEVTEYISIAESRWRQQLAGLGRTVGAKGLGATGGQVPWPELVGDALTGPCMPPELGTAVATGRGGGTGFPPIPVVGQLPLRSYTARILD